MTLLRYRYEGQADPEAGFGAKPFDRLRASDKESACGGQVCGASRLYQRQKVLVGS